MAIDYEGFSSEIFNILKGTGSSVVLFTEDGQRTVDPTEARRFYDRNISMMVNIDDDELKIHLSKHEEVNEEVIDMLRNQAKKYMFEFTIKTYGKQLQPKDFAHMAMNTAVKEGLEKPYGSMKSSYQRINDAKLIIRHTKQVDEEKVGARSRNIKGLYIENVEGERFKFPYIHLTGARAMARHINEGGTPYDVVGEHIIETVKNLKKLQEFTKYVRRNSLVNEQTSDVVNRVNTYKTNAKTELTRIAGIRSYHSMVEQIEAQDAVNEPINELVDQLKEKFTVKYFDQQFEDILPFIANLPLQEDEIVEEDHIIEHWEETVAEMLEDKFSQFNTLEEEPRGEKGGHPYKRDRIKGTSGGGQHRPYGHGRINTIGGHDLGYTVTPDGDVLTPGSTNRAEFGITDQEPSDTQMKRAMDSAEQRKRSELERMLAKRNKAANNRSIYNALINNPIFKNIDTKTILRILRKVL